MDRPQATGAHDFNICLGSHRAANQFLHARNQAIDVGGAGIERLSPCEREQALRQRGRAPRGLLGDVDVPADAFETRPYWREAVALRRYDDTGKRDEAIGRRFADYMPLLRQLCGKARSSTP